MQGTIFTTRHIKEEASAFEEPTVWYGHSGLPLKKFFNINGLKYTKMALKDKLLEISEEDQFALLASD